VVRITTDALAGHLRLGLGALSDLPGRLLKGGKRHSASLGEKAQVRITTKQALMAELAREITHAGSVVQIPGGQVRWQPLDLERPGGRARRKRPLEDRPKRGRISVR
jgi:hypothetical protein